MQIETYSGKYDDEIISLILDIQNNESKINLSLEEQPDLLTIHELLSEKWRRILDCARSGKCNRNSWTDDKS